MNLGVRPASSLRSVSTSNVRTSRSPAYWLFPVVFIIHDSEELLTMPAWFLAHRPDFRVFLSHFGAGSFVDSVPTTFAQTALAIGLFLILICIVTTGVWLRPNSRLWRALYGGLLGTFLLHTLTHVGQAIMFHGYTPGLVTAVLVVAPISALLGASLLRRGAIDLKPSLLVASLGLVLLLPSILGAFRLSQWLLAF